MSNFFDLPTVCVRACMRVIILFLGEHVFKKLVCITITYVK